MNYNEIEKKNDLGEIFAMRFIWGMGYIFIAYVMSTVVSVILLPLFGEKYNIFDSLDVIGGTSIGTAIIYSIIGPFSKRFLNFSMQSWFEILNYIPFVIIFLISLLLSSVFMGSSIKIGLGKSNQYRIIVYTKDNQQIHNEPFFYYWPERGLDNIVTIKRKISISDSLQKNCWKKECTYFKASFYLPANIESIKRYLNSRTGNNNSLEDAIKKDILACVKQITSNGPRYNEYSKNIHWADINDMNEKCPISPTYGYEWMGALRIIMYPAELSGYDCYTLF